jgi:CRP/FNR family transcriptional regulator
MRTLKVAPGEKIRALRENIYFDHASQAELETLVDCVSLREIQRGETLFFESDPCAGLHILLNGCVKLYRLSPQGRQYIVRLCQEKDTFNEVSVFDGGNNPVNAEAIEASQVWVVEPDCLRRLVRTNPDFAQKVIYNLGQNLRHLVQTASELAFDQVTHRLARLLNSLPAGETDGGSPSRWTQEQLAARLGTVREVVARSLRELERSGAIRTENRRIAIADPGVLEQWSQGPWN